MCCEGLGGGGDVSFSGPISEGGMQLPGLPGTSVKRGAIASNAYARSLNGLETRKLHEVIVRYVLVWDLLKSRPLVWNNCCRLWFPQT